MSASRLLVTMLVCFGLMACGDGGSKADAPAVEDTVAGDLAGTMDKARGVEDTSMQHKEDLDRALDAAEQNH